MTDFDSVSQHENMTCREKKIKNKTARDLNVLNAVLYDNGLCFI